MGSRGPSADGRWATWRRPEKAPLRPSGSSRRPRRDSERRFPASRHRACPSGPHDFPPGRSHWCAWTPSGGEIEWDTVTTKYVPNSVIAWQSVGHASVRMTGVLRFIPEGHTTCIKVALDYQVLDGSMADAIVALATPSRGDELEADIRRLAVYLDGVRAIPASESVEA